MTIDYKSYLVQLSEADQRHMVLASDERSAVERLLDQLREHERSEEDLLADYRQAAEQSSNRGVRFLMELILEDEDRHHRLMATMARDVESSLLWLGGQPQLPSVSATGEDRTLLMSQTERFMEIEEATVEDLKELKKAVKRLHSGLLELIVDGMESDTHKHLDILRYILKELDAR